MNRKKVVTVSLIIFLPLIFIAFSAYYVLVAPNVSPVAGTAVIYIPGGATYVQAMDSLNAHLLIRDKKVFRLLAEKKKYFQSVRSGRYVIDRSMSYNELVNILRGGRQTPVKVTFSRARTVNEIAGKIGGVIEADSAEIMDFFSDPENYTGDGFKPEDIIAVFIPNTYELYWNTSAPKLYGRLLREYRRFWNPDRISKCEELDMTPVEVSVLASIVDEEVSRSDEKPRIAGVYINRLREGIPLQADPTIKFAVNDFTIKRVLNKHLKVDSPYNTYLHSGLPPGPVNCPTIEGIEAVLNAEKHDYLFFVAKPDRSGYHNFSRTLTEHNRYASQYRRELNRRRIYK